MISKREWFKPRAFGWGLRPITWEGWVYVTVALLLFVAALNLPISETPRFLLAFGILTVFIIDSLIVMIDVYKKLSPKERVDQHIMESAASYTAVVALVVAILYRAFVDGVADLGLIIVLVIMAVTKGVVYMYLENSKSNKKK